MTRTVFVSLSALWLVAGFVGWTIIQFDCGMGPDSPVACNLEADRKAQLFLEFLTLAYGLFALIYWSRRSRKGR